MYVFKQTIALPLSIEECWDFFSNPGNLQILTPPELKFEAITDEESQAIYAGQIIRHRVRPLLNIPLSWVSEITHVNEFQYFIDEQRFGPFKFWHHEHRFTSIKDGVMVSDLIHYAMPFGWIGKVFHTLKVKNDLEKLFAYRNAQLEKRFGRSV